MHGLSCERKTGREAFPPRGERFLKESIIGGKGKGG
jgi:hypothetical protein